jgi:hypothetical protein
MLFDESEPIIGDEAAVGREFLGRQFRQKLQMEGCAVFQELEITVFLIAGSASSNITGPAPILSVLLIR